MSLTVVIKTNVGQYGHLLIETTPSMNIMAQPTAPPHIPCLTLLAFVKRTYHVIEAIKRKYGT